MRRFIYAALVCMVTVLAGCTAPAAQIFVPQGESTSPRTLAIFFDGTRNSDEKGEPLTNVVKLRNLVRDKSRSDLLTFYIEGVGVGYKPLGAGTGWGTEFRVKAAYGFLLEHYKPGDKILIFGFSRGAFAARMLAAILNYGGLPTAVGLNSLPDTTTLCSAFASELAGMAISSSRSECIASLSGRVYAGYKGKKTPEERDRDIANAIKNLYLERSAPVPVAVLGLWDTVEALGVVDTLEAIGKNLGNEVINNVGERNQRYGDQLCNVKHALHALSLDDNRADVFTPKLLTLPHLFDNCKAVNHQLMMPENFASVDEVWFSGAHSDVGGGYPDCRPYCISDDSLNWMLRGLAKVEPGLLAASKVPALKSEENRSEITNAWSKNKRIYRNVNRDVAVWGKQSAKNAGKPQMHCSVIEHLARKKPVDYGYNWGPQPDACFDRTANGYRYRGTPTPSIACTGTLDPAIPNCWFTVVK